MTNAWKVGLAVVASLILTVLGYFSFSDILPTSPNGESEKPTNGESEKRTKFTILIGDQETKSPLQDVNVFFSYSGAPAQKFTDTNGYVEIEIPFGKDIQVTLSKAGYVTQNFTINSRIDIDTNKTYWLEKDSSPGSSSTSPAPTNGLAPSPSSPAPSIPPSTLQAGDRQILEGTLNVQDRVSSTQNQQCYRFALNRTSNTSFYLDRVTSNVYMTLYEDIDGDGETDRGEERKSVRAYGNGKAASLDDILGVNSYIICTKFEEGNTDYQLQLVNHTSQTKDLGKLESSLSTTGRLSSENRQQYYKFALDRQASVSIVVDNTTADVWVGLYPDTNSTGTIKPREQLKSVTAYGNGGKGTIERALGADTYFIVLKEIGRNTDYNLTLLAQE